MNVLQQLERVAQEREDERYLLVDKLGQGGMGQVWLAEKLGPDGTPFRTVVIKTILPTGSDAEVARRKELFLREMAIAAKLEHSNVVRVTDWGDDLFGSTPFFEMERIKGISLLGLLAARGTPLSEDAQWGALPPQDVAWIGMQAAAGLDYAHNFLRTGEDDTEAGVAHRDVTPDNLMVDIEGVVKVADWGVTKALNAAGEASETRMIAGKVKYMAPEQLRGKIDVRADIYGLGVTLAVALSGKPVFPSSRDEPWESIAIRVIQGQRPRVAELAPDAPPALTDLLERMMSVDPGQRPASAGELVETFAHLAEALGGSLHAVKKAFAQRVREHHKEGRRTKRAIDAAHESAPSYSTRRPITPATETDEPPRPDEGSRAPAGLPSTEALASDSAPRPAQSEPPRSRRRALLLALVVSTLVLVGLLAGVLGFVLPDRFAARPESPNARPGLDESTPQATAADRILSTEAASAADTSAQLADHADSRTEEHRDLADDGESQLVVGGADPPADPAGAEPELGEPTATPPPSGARARGPRPSPREVQPRPLAPPPTRPSARTRMNDLGF
ncbi:MAG: protein kinase [Sandaracinaceae bacterium]|nr:protein kinase [Sandaracinaceae bacterium]